METDERAQVRQMLKERAAKLKELQNELKWAKNEKIVINDDSSNAIIYEEEKYDDLDQMNEDQMIEYARHIQEEDMNILDRVIIDVDQTVSQAQDTATKVADQTAQIGRIGNKLDDIDDELERAKRVLRIMVRRVMTDKVIWVMAGLVFLAVFVIVLQKTGVV